MKKNIFLVLLMLCILWPQKVFAQDNLIEAKQEYIVYEGEYEVFITDYFIYDASGITVTREKVYNGKIVPDRKIYITETGENGVMYGGTLYLVSYTYSNNKTIAIYQGTLTVIS